MSFNQLGLNAKILSALDAQGYLTPTPIQSKAIPVILEGHDVMGGAQTGTGKTAAFSLPILHFLNERRTGGKAPKALILTPTRELAAQVGDNIDKYGANLRLRSSVIFGGVNIKPQRRQIAKGLDILVATPGRLLEHTGETLLDLSKIEILVLDEADRMLDMGFIHDIRRILKLLPVKRQNLMFSATYSKAIKTLADGILHHPKRIEVARQNTAAETVDQVAYLVSQRRKRAMLSHLIKAGDWEQVLVFSRTKHGANRLAKQLEVDNISAVPIHGNKSQSARTKALNDFKKREVRVLVATDIAARGLDIDRLPYVVNYDLPHVAEDYVHRIGRTGRAGSNGCAFSLVSQDDQKLLKGIEKLLKKKIPLERLEGFGLEEPANDRPKRSEEKVSRNRRRKSTGYRRKAAGSQGQRRATRQKQRPSKTSAG